MSADPSRQHDDHGDATQEPMRVSAATKGLRSEGVAGKSSEGPEPKPGAGSLQTAPKAAGRNTPHAPPGMPRTGDSLSMSDRRLARGLGWFSFALGIPQVVMPRQISRLVGLYNTPLTRQIMRLVGFREIATGAGIFTSQPKPAEWLWVRVAGDVIDLGMLSKGFGNPKNRKGRLLFAAANVFGVTTVDLMQAVKHSRALKNSGEMRSLQGRTSITVNRPPDELYSYWHDFENLPRFMFHVQTVERNADERYHWVVKAPFGQTVEWNAGIVEDIPNELITWRTTDDADVPNSGSVRFVPAPGSRGTEVIVEVDYQLPGGAIGDAIARLFGEGPEQQLKDDLRRFKQVIETGQVVRSEGSPEGTYALNQVKWRPAQPLP